jgi:hypothetical protein
MGYLFYLLGGIPFGCGPVPVPLPVPVVGGGCDTPPDMARSSSGESRVVVSVCFSGFVAGLVG